MTFGPKHCACCGSTHGIEAHHLYPKLEGCPDDLTVWLCHECHGRLHGQPRRPNLSEIGKALWHGAGFRKHILAVFRAKRAVRTRRKNAAARLAGRPPDKPRGGSP